MTSIIIQHGIIATLSILTQRKSNLDCPSGNKWFSGWTDKVFNAELDFVIEKIKFAMDNESCWNYLRAILEHDLLKETKGTIYYKRSNVEVIQYMILF